MAENSRSSSLDGLPEVTEAEHQLSSTNDQVVRDIDQQLSETPNASFRPRQNSNMSNEVLFLSPSDGHNNSQEQGGTPFHALYTYFIAFLELITAHACIPVQESCSDGPSELVIIPLPKVRSSSNEEECIRNLDHFKYPRYYQQRCINGVIYSTSKLAEKAQPGRKLHSKVYESICCNFVFKERFLNVNVLENWRKIKSDYIMPLRAVILHEPNSLVAYEVTDKMTGDLLTMRRTNTLVKVLKSCNPVYLKNALQQVKKISIAIVTGICDLNKYGFQHYDIKEQNILMKRPTGCSCPCIFTCGHDWEVKVSDFDTLDIIKLPYNAVGGTKYHRPPETASMDNQLYSKPTYDTYSFGVLLLHMLCGHGKDFINMGQTMRMTQYSEYSYVKDMLLCLDDECISNKEMQPMIVPWRNVIKLCINDNPSLRPTAAEILKEIEKFP